MYEEFFGLRRRPFAAAPAAEAYLPTAALEHARKALIRTIERGDGPALVIGPAGSGKSLLGQILAHHFQNRFSVALLNSARLDSCRSLLQNILYELELPYRELEEGEMRLSLVDYLRRNDTCPRGLILIVDEAHLLPLRLLEEIRLITNIVDHGASRVRLVLIGGPQLEERFTSPKLESFNQRIAARCYLQALNYDETTQYIEQMLIQAGGVVTIFAADAKKAVYRASDGIPRLINQVSDQALMLAFLAGKKLVGVELVEEAWADLQQLPAPWQNPRIDHQLAAATSAETVIEFGSLEDEELPAVLRSAQTVSHDFGPVERSEVQLDLLDSGLAEYAEEPSLEPIIIGQSPVEWIEAEDVTYDPGIAETPFALSLRALQDFEPDQTEIELKFTSRRDVFGNDFHEEETVVDHYAGLTAGPLPTTVSLTVKRSTEPVSTPASEPQPLPQEAFYTSVQCVELALNRNLAAELTPQISMTSGSMVNVVDTFSELVPQTPVQSQGKQNAERPTVEKFDPASDPVQPELLPLSQEGVAREPLKDDRDILLIEGAHRERTPRRKTEFKQLFSSLRKA